MQHTHCDMSTCSTHCDMQQTHSDMHNMSTCMSFGTTEWIAISISAKLIQCARAAARPEKCVILTQTYGHVVDIHTDSTRYRGVRVLCGSRDADASYVGQETEISVCNSSGDRDLCNSSQSVFCGSSLRNGSLSSYGQETEISLTLSGRCHRH